MPYNFAADSFHIKKLVADFLGKRVVDFLLVLIELFSPGVTAEELRANSG